MSDVHAGLLDQPPSTRLWVAAGSPVLGLGWEPADREAGCAHCCSLIAAGGLRVRVDRVISDKFTGWDAYPNVDGTPPLWCPACAWAFREPTLRQQPCVASACGAQPRGGETSEPAGVWDEVWVALMDPQWTQQWAVTVPVGRKKHLVPAARWGCVATDSGVLPWNGQDQRRLGVVAWLRGLGFTETAIREPSPRFDPLIGLAEASRAEVLAVWGSLDPWREYPAYLDVAVRASRSLLSGCPAIRPTSSPSVETVHTEPGLSPAGLPPLSGADAVAERLVALVHSGVDWDVWGGRRIVRYWEALTERVRAATYAGPGLGDWWRHMATYMASTPRTAQARHELVLLLAHDPRPVLDSLHENAEVLVLRTRVAVEQSRTASSLVMSAEPVTAGA